MRTRIITNSFSPRRQWLLRSAAALLAAAVIAAIPGRAHAGVFVSVNIAPPPLPVYVQPPIPGPGYIWTPGYWAWGDGGYYWVPGAWVLAPFIGALWTPGYWGWSGGFYIFHAGYWGRHVGFYGGINYGYGYGGRGYDGGYWRGGGFYYNRSVNHVTNHITNVYSRTVINHGGGNRVSYNGGPRGIAARATPQQQAWGRERHTAPVAAQLQQRTAASRMQSMRATVNHGTPPITATPRAGALGGVTARGAPAATAARATRYTPPAASAPQRGALRSAGYAPHANASAQSAGASRYNPSASGRYHGGAASRPQAYQSRSYQPRSYRQAPQHYAQPAYRPANTRPAQQRAAAPRGQGGGGGHRGGHDDRHH